MVFVKTSITDLMETSFTTTPKYPRRPTLPCCPTPEGSVVGVTNRTQLRWMSHSRLFCAYGLPWILQKPTLRLRFE